MTDVYQLKKRFCFELKELYPTHEIESFFYLLAEHILALSRVELALTKVNLTKKQIFYFENAILQLKKEKPIQYITGSTLFYNLPFYVNENVLIPRPETEELINEVLKNTNCQQKINILDVGTGSGCIAISLAKNIKNANVYGLDISEKALEIAKKNAVLNKVKISFLKKDILQTTNLQNLQFDIIVSNPPYVRNSEKKDIRNNVLLYEPHIALFVENNNPLLFYNKIADFAKKNLHKNGLLFFEINQYLGKDTCQLLINKGFSKVLLKKDFYNNDRMIQARI